MANMSMKWSLALLCSSILIVSGCGESGGSASSSPASQQSNLEASSNAKSLNLNLNLESLAKQVTPAATSKALFEVAPIRFSKVIVLLTHPVKKVQKTVELPVVDNKASGRIEGLVTGDWELEVLVLNTDQEAVFGAKQQINIAAGKTTKISLAFEPIDPTGDLDIELIPKPTFNELEWKPAVDAVPTTGNYVYLESQVGDYIGQGRSYLYTSADAGLVVDKNILKLGVTGNEDWSGDFVLPNALNNIQQGLYQQLQRYPFHAPEVGGLSWSGEGRGCNTLNGWISIDKVEYEGTAVKSVDFRFSQHCEGGAPALLGAVHWVFDRPVGTNWQPDPAKIPTQGNYVYLESDRGDYIGQGQTYVYTGGDAKFTLNNKTPALLDMTVDGQQYWTGQFAMPQAQAKLTTGLYENLQRYPFHNMINGGLNWSGEGRGCNTLSGWFSVDQATYVGKTLQSVDIRFQQNCSDDAPSLRGKIHWTK